MGQKMSDIFFQYQDFSKSRYPGFFQNTFFARRVLSFLWLPGFFKKFSATGKSRYWRNFTSTFLPVSRCKTPMGFITYGSLSKNPIGIPVQDFWKISYRIGIFAGASLTSITTARPREVATLWPTMFTLQPTRRLRVVLGAYSHRPLFPFPLCSHFYSSSQHETTHFLSFAFLVEFCPRNI